MERKSKSSAFKMSLNTNAPSSMVQTMTRSLNSQLSKKQKQNIARRARKTSL